MSKVYGVILSGGSGQRMNHQKPKQFLKIAGKSLLYHSVSKFKQTPVIDKIILVVHPEFKEESLKEVEDFFDENDLIAFGGSSRHESTLNAIACVRYFSNDVFIFHDCARPFVTQKEIADVFDATLKFGAASVGSPVSDTIVTNSENKVENILKREEISLLKTPQGIHGSILDVLMKHKIETEPTDLCSWVIQIGVKPNIVPANLWNIKITYPEDINFAENILR